MIKKIRLVNFKCFEELNASLENITVLTGINGMGKSTLIQALLLLRQSAPGYAYNHHFRLNGDLIQLGRGKDILWEAAENDSEIQIGIQENDSEMSTYHLKYEPYFDELEVYREGSSDPELMTGERCIYLSAYRIQPLDLYGITNAANLNAKRFGNDGMYALQYLKEYGPQPIEEALVLDEEKYPNSLYNQARWWMDKIAPGVSMEIDVDEKKQLATLGYSFTEGKSVTNTYNCVNVGFGITYVLPVVVALLSAKKGDVILLENPEAHIHPAGQRRLGELIAWVGRTGVQVIVETHSDHILNGIRISVKNKLVSKEDVSLLYFYKDEKDHYKHKFESPRINEDGRIDFWPRGFFDEWDNALLELL